MIAIILVCMFAVLTLLVAWATVRRRPTDSDATPFEKLRLVHVAAAIVVAILLVTSFVAQAVLGGDVGHTSKDDMFGIFGALAIASFVSLALLLPVALMARLVVTSAQASRVQRLFRSFTSCLLFVTLLGAIALLLISQLQ